MSFKNERLEELKQAALNECVDPKDLPAMLEFLDECSASGVEYMFEHRAYLIREFSLKNNRDSANKILSYWMESSGTKDK